MNNTDDDMSFDSAPAMRVRGLDEGEEKEQSEYFLYEKCKEYG